MRGSEPFLPTQLKNLPICLISVVLPCYKDASHLRESVLRITQTLKLLRAEYEVILVNDASPDDCGPIADQLQKELGSELIRVVHHDRNRGRGAAFLSGVREASGEIVGFLDVDLEVSQVYLVECLRQLIHEGAEMVIGQRHYRLQVGLIHRHLLSRGYSLLVSRFLGIPREIDSECGYKFFRRDVLQKYLDRFTHGGWFWDTEVVNLFWREGRRITIVPCLFLRNDDKASTIRPIRDILAYAYNLWRYRRASGSASRLATYKEGCVRAPLETDY